MTAPDTAIAPLPPETIRRLRELTDRFTDIGAAERANYQLYLTELCDALGVEKPRPATADVVLYRGNLDRIVVSLAWFANMASGAVADPAKLAVIDHEQTVSLGAFKASTDAILYEFDDEYRKTVKRRTLAQDMSLGGSLRRLRGLTQHDCPGVTAETIARIERGAITTPHATTLAVIAKRLDVVVADLATFCTMRSHVRRRRVRRGVVGSVFS